MQFSVRQRPWWVKLILTWCPYCWHTKLSIFKIWENFKRWMVSMVYQLVMGEFNDKIWLIYKCFMVILSIFNVLLLCFFNCRFFFVCTQLYGCKYSNLVQIIYTQLHGFRKFLFDNNHLFANSYMVASIPISKQ